MKISISAGHLNSPSSVCLKLLLYNKHYFIFDVWRDQNLYLYIPNQTLYLYLSPIYWSRVSIIHRCQGIALTNKRSSPDMGGFHGGSDSKESTCNAGDLNSIPGLGRSPREGHGNPLQHSCLENPHGQRSLWTTVHCVAESDATSRLSTTSHMEASFPLQVKHEFCTLGFSFIY